MAWTRRRDTKTAGRADRTGFGRGVTFPPVLETLQGKGLRKEPRGCARLPPPSCDSREPAARYARDWLRRGPERLSPSLSNTMKAPLLRPAARKPFLLECSHCARSLLVRGTDLEDAATRLLVHGWRAFSRNALHCASCDGRKREKGCEHWAPQRNPARWLVRSGRSSS